MAAAQGGYPAIVEALLGRGASADARDARGESALLKAAEEGHTLIVSRLARAGADVNAEDARGRRPLELAAERAFSDLMETLLELGAELDPAVSTRLAENAERQGLTDVVSMLRPVPTERERS